MSILNTTSRAVSLPTSPTLVPGIVRFAQGVVLALACSVLFGTPTLTAQDDNLVPNGEFEIAGADGWVKDWEQVLLSADCTVEATQAEGGNPVVRVTGATKKSRGGLQTNLKRFEGPPLFRVSLRYRGQQGRRLVVIRRESGQDDQKPVEQRIPLEPSREWRPAGGMVTLPEAGDEEEGQYVILLLHEGKGETWFDGVVVVVGQAAPRPAQPGAAPVGPYATSFFPEDGTRISVNPPRLRWPGRHGATYTVEWSTSPDFPPEKTQRAEHLKLNLYIPPEPLSPGTWYWRVSELIASLETPALPEAEQLDEQYDEEAPVEDVEGEEKPIETPAKPETEPQHDGEPQTAAEVAAVSASVALQVTLVEQQRPADLPGKGDKPTDKGEDTGQPKGPEETFPGPGQIKPEAPTIEQPPTPTPRPRVSATYTFRVDESAATVPVPPVEAIIAAPGSHPRIWLTADKLVSLRSLTQGPLKPRWEALEKRLEQAKGQDLPAEPKGRGKWRKPSPKQLAANQQILQVAQEEAGLVRDFAFAALVAGDESYAAEAKRRALNLAGWDPKGSTGYVSHDQAFREILLALALALDWLPQWLSEEESQKLIETVTSRGNTLYEALSEGPRPLNLFPYSSHGQTAVGFLTVVALAVVGDVPEAEDWLKFALPTAVNLFSPWAGDDGGWMQGETYWKRSAPFTFQLFDALQTAADVDLYALPWAKNTVKYKVYMHPPYSTRGGFGDGPEISPEAQDRLAMLRLASALKDPLAAWYAASVKAPESDPTAFDILWRDPDLQPEPPDKLPPSAAFGDSGLFAMHSSLTDPNGVHLYGRASRFGSFNHAHADQNHFTLYAFGEPLLIDAGYYDWYRSPHATSFSRTTLAHNTLLVNNKIGQRTGDITARGKLEAFFTSPWFDYACLEAAEAYPRRILKSFRRHFIFCRPNWIVVWDHVEASEKVTLAWLLHSLEEPTLDAEASSAIVRRGRAALAIGAFGPEKLVWTTTSRFPKNPRFVQSDIQVERQWHTTVRTTAKSEQENLVLMLAPFQEEQPPEVSPLDVEGGKGARIVGEGRTLVALVRVGEAASVASAGLTSQADCIVAKLADGAPEVVFAEKFRSLEHNGSPLLSASSPCRIAAHFGDKPALVVEADEKTTVTVAVPTQPGTVQVDGKTQEIKWAQGMLTIEVPSGYHRVVIEP